MEETRAYVASKTTDGEWLEARVVSQADDGSVVLETLETKEEHHSHSDKLLLCNELPEDGVEDMTRLNYLHEPALLHNLRHRFGRDHVYTYTGKICIAVNPFNWKVSQPLYTESLLVRYRNKELGDMPPHIYAIAEDAYRQIVDQTSDGRNQSILVSGESGAGKTESVKIMMQYLAVVSKSGDQNRVAAQVLASNPLLEAFGNARTTRNNNSSRFGKFIEIQFDAAYKMAGARIHIYLLEKTRVVHQTAGERNYHIFYQLLAAPAQTLAAVHLSLPIEQYALLNQSGCVAIDGVDDASELRRTRGAMGAIGMAEEEQTQVMRTLAAVLLLAQLSFAQDEEEHASVDAASSEVLLHVASLLGPESPDDLSSALTTRRLVTRDDEITVLLSLEQAKDSRDALAKSVYGKLFIWLVERCNAKLVDDDAATAFVGILDIFGFEAFKVNSFEQLCINYANERLQQQFNWDVFKSEQAEYEREGIAWQYIEFVDNQECLDLIDRKDMMGILHLLDEECAIQKGTDEKLVHKLREKHKGHAYFGAPKRDQSSFSVRHYAGEVTYLSTGFREKNKDALHPDLAAVMQESTSDFVRDLFPQEKASGAATPSKASRKGKGGKSADRMTVGSQFMVQLASLMRTINSTGVHYVRCIKPNTASAAAVFETAHSALQLRCAGVLEAVRISRMAYPNRMAHGAFGRRYALLAPKAWQLERSADLTALREAPPGDAQALAMCQALLKLVVEDASRYQLGKTKVFFRALLLESLEQRRSAALSKRAIILQKRLRGHHRRRLYLAMRTAAVLMQAAGRRTAATAAYQRARVAATRQQAVWRVTRSRRHAKQLRAATLLEAHARARAARVATYHKRRHVRATTLQSHLRMRVGSRRHRAMRNAAVRMQTWHRMASQRRQYKRELAEAKEEAKLSNQLARMQAQLQAEIEARQRAEQEQERLRTEGPSSAAPTAAPPALGDIAAHGSSISARMAGVASKFLGQLGGMQSTTSMEETSAMLSAVTKDREKLSMRLASETEARKRLELEKRELERKLRLGSATSQLETRKTHSVAEALSRKKDEIAEMRALIGSQTLELSDAQAAALVAKKRLASLEKQLGEYDDKFFSLEARNVRDRARFEEMGKAKAAADEQKSIYRAMLEHGYERWASEQMELRKEAQAKLEASANKLRTKNERIRMQDERLAALEKELLEKRQVEEEKNQYREQYSALMEQCSSLMEQLSAAHGGAPAQMPPPPPPPPGSSERGEGGRSRSMMSPPSGGLLGRVASGVRKSVAAAQEGVKEAVAHAAAAHSPAGDASAEPPAADQ